LSEAPARRRCERCGGEYQPRLADPIAAGLCRSRAACRREVDKRYRLIRTRALNRLATECPERTAELVAEEAARFTAPVLIEAA
jgi:hypothetical protein